MAGAAEGKVAEIRLEHSESMTFCSTEITDSEQAWGEFIVFLFRFCPRLRSPSSSNWAPPTQVSEASFGEL